MIEELILSKDSGIYVLSFNMERPMVYYQPFPQSDRLVDKNMIKVGKCKEIRTRMGGYRRTYGYRRTEPLKTESYWISQGFKDRHLKRCLGCDLREPHDHVEYEHISPTPFVDEANYYKFHDRIENKISEKFCDQKIWRHMEYYRKEIKDELIEEVILLIDSEKNRNNNF